MAAEDERAYFFYARDEQDTSRLAAFLAESSGPGSVIAVDGELGAGKTRFSQAFARHAGVEGTVSSPTFTLIKEYQAAAWPLYHMDMYRLQIEEAEELGLDEYLYGEGVTIIEWAGRIRDLLPDQRLDIYIENTGGTSRVFRLAPLGSSCREWCRILLLRGEVQ